MINTGITAAFSMRPRYITPRMALMQKMQEQFSARTSCTCTAPAHPCARGIPYFLYMHRSCASMRPRYTVLPVHKKCATG